MRIAVAYDCLFPWSTGGGERQYRVFAEEFAAAGHEVTYLTRNQWDGPPPGIDGLTVRIVSGDRELYDATGTRTTGPAIRFARGLFVHLLRHRHAYDAVLVSATPASNVPAVRAALAGSAVTIAVDWLEVFRPDQWREYSGPVMGRVASGVQRLAVRLSPIASCHSRLVAGRLRALGSPGEPVVSPGLIADELVGKPSLEVPDPPHVVYVGRHIADKRVEVLPAAIAHAREQLPSLTATIYGDGATRGAVLAEIDRLNLRDVVDAPGFVSQEELDEGLRTASCLVNPSMREGYGLVGRRGVRSRNAGRPGCRRRQRLRRAGRGGRQRRRRGLGSARRPRCGDRPRDPGGRAPAGVDRPVVENRERDPNDPRRRAGHPSPARGGGRLPQLVVVSVRR